MIDFGKSMSQVPLLLDSGQTRSTAKEHIAISSKHGQTQSLETEAVHLETVLSRRPRVALPT